MYISPIVRQRRRQRILFAALIALGLIICLLPAPAHQDATATAAAPAVPIAKKQGFS